MIRHTIHSITIRQYSKMEATKDIKAACKLRLPLFFCRTAAAKLQAEVAQLFDNKAIDKEILKLLYYNKYTLLFSVYVVLKLNPDNKTARRVFRDEMRREFNGNADELMPAITKAKEKYDAIIKQDKKEDPRTFENLIADVETILGYPINPNTTLYEFKAKYDTAIKKINQLKKENPDELRHR